MQRFSSLPKYINNMHVCTLFMQTRNEDFQQTLQSVSALFFVFTRTRNTSQWALMYSWADHLCISYNTFIISTSWTDMMYQELCWCYDGNSFFDRFQKSSTSSRRSELERSWKTGWMWTVCLTQRIGWVTPRRDLRSASTEWWISCRRTALLFRCISLSDQLLSAGGAI